MSDAVNEKKPELLWFYIKPYIKLQKKNHHDCYLHLANNIEHLVEHVSKEKKYSLNYMSNIFNNLMALSKIELKLSNLKILEKINQVSKLGIKKYDYKDYSNGLKLSSLVNALMRHFVKQVSYFEDIVDEESGESHLIHMLATVMMMTDENHKNDIYDIYKEIKEGKKSDN
jgi:Domain of unknown function (DUF5664)